MESRRSRLVATAISFIVLATIVSGAVAHAAPEDWPPVTDAEKAIKDCAAQPGAAAVYLYREQISDQNEWTFKAYYRLKILTAAGKDHGTVEVPFSEAWRVKDIQARVVRPDGSSRPFTGEIFEKTIVQVGRLKRLVKTFALPDLDVGSIIDYRYELKLDLKKAASARSLGLERWKPEEGGMPGDVPPLSYTVELWDFDSPLYTYKAKYAYVPFHGGQISFDNVSLRLAWVAYGLTWGPPVMNEGRIVLEVDHIPAREKEEWAAPEGDGQMGVIFFLCDTKVLDASDYWRLEGANWQKAAQKFMAADAGLANESQILVEGAATRLDELKALYARAQRIKNLSYDKDMTPARRKELKIKDNRNVGDVLKRDAGLRSDITRTFVALARAAGFTADAARVVTRDDKFFHPNVLGLYGQFDSEIAVVDVDGRDQFFDPATPGCPMGLVRWSATDTTFIRTSGEPGKFDTIPPDPPERSTVEQAFDLRLDGAGGLSGTATLTCTGQEALSLRLEYLDADDAEMKKSLGEKMAALLPKGGQASVRKIENMTGSEDRLQIEYEVAVPGVAAAAGDRLLLPVVPFRAGWRDSFRHARRRGSVYFPYLEHESDDIVIALPENVKVDTVPAACQSERSFARYSLTAAAEDGRKLHVRRELTIGKGRVPADQYPVLKSFFDQARAGDDGQIVLAPEKKQPASIPTDYPVPQP
jgi:hypothetical protein